jgi:predicted enzyme related to lactoylglutathione lyase
MASRFTTIVIDATDVRRVGEFWSSVLGRQAELDDDGDMVLKAPDGESVDVLVLAVPEAKRTKNRLHIDLNPIAADQDEELERLLALGATRVDIGQGEPSWVVLADPEGNEFCLLSRRIAEAGAPSAAG